MSCSLPQHAPCYQFRYRTDNSLANQNRSNSQQNMFAIPVKCITQEGSKERLKKKIIESQKQHVFKLNMLNLD